jgi:hypothetical protein
MASSRPHRLGRVHYGVLFFLIAFTTFLIFLSSYYLLPALRTFLEAKESGDKRGVHAISATSALLLAVLLVILITGLILTFRIGRFFFPRKTPPRTQTKYVDAWSESAKRMETPPPGE